MRAFASLALLAAVLAVVHEPPRSAAPESPPSAPGAVAFDQRPGALLPDVDLVAHDGQPTRLSTLLADGPSILILGYYRCKVLCHVVFDEVAEALERIPLQAGDDYRVVVVSIDPSDGPGRAAGRREALADEHDPHGWHFLTGPAAATRSVADAVGFRYTWDADTGQYSHPAGLVVLTPGGRVSATMLGVRFQPRDLRLALLEAGQGRIGGVVDQLLLRCYAYDPATGRYGFAVVTGLRVAGVATVMVVLLLLGVSARRERRTRSEP